MGGIALTQKFILLFLCSTNSLYVICPFLFTLTLCRLLFCMWVFVPTIIRTYQYKHIHTIYMHNTSENIFQYTVQLSCILIYNDMLYNMGAFGPQNETQTKQPCCIWPIEERAQYTQCNAYAVFTA